MLIRMKYHLRPERPLSCRNASLFQGMLMQRIDPQYGEILHRSELKPYSQYLDCQKDQAIWVLQTLTDIAENQIINTPHFLAGKSICLERLGLSAKITGIDRETLTQEELLEQTFFTKCPRTVKVQFITPTAFKVQGRYQNYPTIQHIFGSLIQKYNAVHTTTEIAGENLLEDLQRFTSVIGYNLRNTTFPVEGITIPSFVGTLLLKISGPQQMVNLVHLLLYFGTYSGIGIKTAMGMGALRIIERKDVSYERDAVPNRDGRTAP